MSSYLPPTQDLDKFNPVVFPNGDDTGISLGEADARYVKKSGSIMTGSLSAPSISITNTLTLEGEDVGTKLTQIDTNTSNISNNSTAITTLQTKTSDLTYDSGTDTSTFSGKLIATDETTVSNTLDAILNIKSGNSLSNDAFLKFFNAGLYKGGMYSSTDGIIINSRENNLGNYPDIQFRFEDGVISSLQFQITDTNVITYQPIIPGLNGLYDIGTSSKFFNKVYSEDVNTQNHASIDTAITNNINSINTNNTAITNNTNSINTNNTAITNNTNSINTNSTAITNLQTKTQYLSTSGSGSSTKSSFSSAQLEVVSDYDAYIIIKGDENNDSGIEGAHLQFYTFQQYQGEIRTLGSDITILSHSTSSIKPFYFKLIENGSITYTQLEINKTDSIFNTNIIPKVSSTNTLGSATKFWNQGYINNISTSSFSDLNSTLGGIATNSTAITNNTNSINTNSTNITTNTNNISTNSTNISNNTSSISTNSTNITTNTNSINTNFTAIVGLDQRTNDLSNVSGDYFLATNLFEITAGNTGDCVLRLRSDQDDNDDNDNCFIKFSQDGTSDKFSMGFNNNSLEFKSAYSSTEATNSSNFVFFIDDTITKFKIGDNVVCNASFTCQDIIPQTNNSKDIGTSTKAFASGFINDITTSNHTSIDTDITNLETKTQYISVSGNEMTFSNQTIFHENNESVYFVLNGDKDNNNASLGSYLTLYAHNVFNGYLGTIGDFLDLHSFSAGTVKPIKFTFEDSVGTHTSLSCDDVNITFNINILPQTTNTFSIGASGNIFSTSYFSNIITSSHNVNTVLNTLNTNTQHISATSTITTIAGNFLDVNCQFDLPNNSDVDSLLTFYASSILTLQTEVQAVEDKTAGLTANGSNTESTGQLIISYNTDDTTIDWGLIDNGRTNVSGFKKSIFLDTEERDCFIGVVNESSSTAAGVGIAYNAGGGDDPNVAIYFCSNNQAYFRSHINSGHAKPIVNNTYDLGSSSRRWDDVYATNGTINTSDEKEKHSIETLDETEMTDFISKLNPVKYIYNEKVRYHCGLISQEVKEEMPFDWGLYIHDEEMDSYGLRYTELISPMISVIQNLIKENNNLKIENDNIKNRLNTIEELLGIS